MDITEKVFKLADELGPEKVVFLYEPRTQMKAIVVVDNVAAGPAIGGVRMALDVTATEVRRLARAMTYKNAMAGLPHGGGKSGIIASPRTVHKEQIIRTFAKAIKHLEEYIPGPDMGTDETSMAYIYDETSRAVGLPVELGGIPLDEIGATAYGIAVCADVAKDYVPLDLNGARLTIEGFGNVGKPTARDRLLRRQDDPPLTGPRRGDHLRPHRERPFAAALHSLVPRLAVIAQNIHRLLPSS